MSLSRRDWLTAALAASVAPRLEAHAQNLREVGWLAEVQEPPGRDYERQKLSDLLRVSGGKRIDSLDGWRGRRAELRRGWERVLRPLDLPRVPPRLETLEEDRPDGCIRRLVRYESEPGLPVEGYLILPREVKGQVPGVVALHSTVPFTIRQPAGLEGDPEDFFGLEMARRGYVAFCPRCFLWQGPGDYESHVAGFRQRRPQSLGMAKMLWDAMRAVDVLESLSQVDGKRIGAVGHSLGAKEVLYLAAFDERIRVAVSSEGGIGTTFSNWDAPWYLGDAARAPQFEREHHELLALVAPRAFLLLGGDSADGDRSWPFIEAALEVYRLYGGAPRVGLFNHRRGHSVPPSAQEKLYDWLVTYL